MTSGVLLGAGATLFLLPSASALATHAPTSVVWAEDGNDPPAADQSPASDAPAPVASTPSGGDSGTPSNDAADKPANEATDEPSADVTDEASDGATDEPTDEASDEPTDEASDGATDEPTDEASDGATDEPTDQLTDQLTGDATTESGAPVDTPADLGSASPEMQVPEVPQVAIQGTVGTPIGAVTVGASGAGLAPSSPFEMVVYSEPQVIASGTADAQGAFATTATLPANLAPGAHTVVFRGTGADGSPVESGVGFTVASDGTLGEVTGSVDAAALAELAPVSEVPGGVPSAITSKAPDFAPVVPLDSPAAVVTTTIAALTLVTAAGAAAAGAGGGARSGGSHGGGSGGGSGDSGGGVDAKVEDRGDLDIGIDTSHNRGWRTRFQAQGANPGDTGRTHRFPGTAFVDELSYASILAVAPRSPLLARAIDDAGPWRAMFGSLSLVFPVAGIAVGIASALSTGGIAQPPALALMIALLAIGVLDSLAGLLAVIAFTGGVAISGGIVDLASVRTLLGIALLVLGPGLMASSFRDTRRPAARTTAQWWERATDLVVVPLMGAWVTMSVVEALPGLAGYAFPITESATVLALVVMALLVLNVLLEEAAARWFPERMATVLPSGRPAPGAVQMLISGLFRMGLFLFVSAAFVGNVWQLWVAAVLFTVPNLLRIVDTRLPNSPRLWQVLPAGLPQLGVLLMVSGVVAAAVASALGQTPQFAQMSFVILAVPGFVLDGLRAFGREPAHGDVRWYCRPSMVVLYRVGGVVVLMATVWLAMNV